jgi:hypothetical protein
MIYGELEKEYANLLVQLNKMKKNIPPKRLAPIQNLINLNELRDEAGQVRLFFGVCENEIAGERLTIGNNLLTKTVGLSLW